MRIKPFTSFSLDVLRVFAALGVAFSHLSVTGLVPQLPLLNGHLFVVCFFVLSGFVIAATTNVEKTTSARYFSLRLARLWTVAIPCLVITLVLELIGHRLAPEHYANFDRGWMIFRYILTTAFLNESGVWSGGPPTNGPVWSLAYEAWYYVLFGIALFVRPTTLRRGLLLIGCILAGPRILLLLPVWLLGVLTWKLCNNPDRLYGFRWLIFAVSLLLTAVIIYFRPEWPGYLLKKPFYYSGAWISDIIFGFGVAGIILSIDLIWGKAKVPDLLGMIIRDLAGVSFTFYLLHFPLMVFVAGVIPYNPRNPIHLTGVVLGIVLPIYAIAKVIEPQRKYFSPRFESKLLGLNKLS